MDCQNVHNVTQWYKLLSTKLVTQVIPFQSTWVLPRLSAFSCGSLHMKLSNQFLLNIFFQTQRLRCFFRLKSHLSSANNTILKNTLKFNKDGGTRSWEIQAPCFSTLHDHGFEDTWTIHFCVFISSLNEILKANNVHAKTNTFNAK